MTKLTLTDTASGYALTTTLNTNNDSIETAIENTLSRDGTAPNTMSANLDLNSNSIVNLTDGANNQDACTVAQLNAASVVASTIAGSAVTIADAGTYFTGTTAEGVLQELGATTGAGVIGLLDTAGNVAATNVEDAIAEVYTDSAAATAALAATTNGNGAALIGVEDAAGNFAGTTVEVVLTDIGTNYVRKIKGSEIVQTTNVITAAETGSTFYLDLVGGFTSTLPAPAIGLNYTFIVSTAPTTAYIVTTNAGANVLYGTLLDIVGEQVYFAAQDQVNFVAATSLIGDRLEVESDGTNWYCKIFSGANGGITVAVT